MVDGHETVTDETCGRCGRDPAEGFAEINNVRYCHGDTVDEHGDTCYERTTLIRMQSGYEPDR